MVTHCRNVYCCSRGGLWSWVAHDNFLVVDFSSVVVSHFNDFKRTRVSVMHFFGSINWHLSANSSVFVANLDSLKRCCRVDVHVVIVRVVCIFGMSDSFDSIMGRLRSRVTNYDSLGFLLSCSVVCQSNHIQLTVMYLKVRGLCNVDFFALACVFVADSHRVVLRNCWRSRSWSSDCCHWFNGSDGSHCGYSNRLFLRSRVANNDFLGLFFTRCVIDNCDFIKLAVVDNRIWDVLNGNFFALSGVLVADNSFSFT